MLSAEQIKQFQVLYERRFGRQISEQQAYDMGMKLVTLVKLTGTAQGKAQKKRNEGNHHDKEKNLNGEGGIRTHGTLAGTPVFKTGAFNHSATSPFN